MPGKESKSEILQLIALRVAKRRHELGLSQEELAVKARLHRTYISDVERGQRNVTIGVLSRIADALDIPAGFLLL